MPKVAETHDVTNEAIFWGTIVSIRGKGNNGSLTLACPCIANTRRQGKLESNVKVNYPSLSFNADTKTKNILAGFKVRDHVRINGHVQSYLQMDERDGETREIMNVYIDEIALDPSKMMGMFGKEGRMYPEAKNEVYLSGVLAGIVKRTETALSIRLDVSGNRRNLLNAMYYRASASTASELAIGANVDILAMVQTVDTKAPKSPQDGQAAAMKTPRKIRGYQELVILDIGK